MITEEKKLELIEKLVLNYEMTTEDRQIAEQLAESMPREEYEDYEMLFKGLDGLAADSLLADMKSWDAEEELAEEKPAAKVFFLPNFKFWQLAASVLLLFGLSYSLYQLLPQEDRYFASLPAAPLYSFTRGEAPEASQALIAQKYRDKDYAAIVELMAQLSLAELQAKDLKTQLALGFSSIKTGKELEKAEAMLLAFPQEEDKMRLMQLKDFQLLLISYQLGKEERMQALAAQILKQPRHECYAQVQAFYEEKGLALPQ